MLLAPPSWLDDVCGDSSGVEVIQLSGLKSDSGTTASSKAGGSDNGADSGGAAPALLGSLVYGRVFVSVEGVGGSPMLSGWGKVEEEGGNPELCLCGLPLSRCGTPPPLTERWSTVCSELGQLVHVARLFESGSPPGASGFLEVEAAEDEEGDEEEDEEDELGWGCRNLGPQPLGKEAEKGKREGRGPKSEPSEPAFIQLRLRRFLRVSAGSLSSCLPTWTAPGNSEP